MKLNVVIVGAGSDYLRFLWSDSLEKFQGQFVEFKYPRKIHFIYKLCCSKKVNLVFKTPIFLFRRFNFKFEKFLKKDKKNIVIFTDLIPAYFDYSYQKELKKKYNLEFVFLFLNDMRAILGNNEKRIFNFLKKLNSEFVYTFDKGDSEKFQIRYFVGTYPNIKNFYENKRIIYDFLYIGKAKNRIESIETLYKILAKNGFNCYFVINDVENNHKRIPGIIYNKQIPYTEYLDRLFESKCIVEINEATQTGVTLRYLEALSAGKKLLTNNQNIKYEKYFNNSFIGIVPHGDESIDFSFLNSPSDINYNGDYTSANFLSSIIKEIKMKENLFSSNN